MSGFTPNQRVSEQKSPPQNRTAQQRLGRCPDFAQCRPRLRQRRGDFTVPAQNAQGPADRKSRGGKSIIGNRAEPVQADNHKHATGLQQPPEANQPRLQRQMVQRRDRRNAVEALLRERTSHDVRFDVLDARLDSHALSGTYQRVVVDVDSHHFIAAIMLSRNSRLS